MRNLTKKQKNLLTKWYKEREPSKTEKLFFNKDNDLRNFEDLTTEEITVLERINDTEILYQTVNQFLWDLRTDIKGEE